MTRLDLTPVFRTAVGFDRMANLVDSMIAGGIDNQSNWPPYNIEKYGENAYRISMAVAGFGEDDLNITIHDQMLIVQGTQSAMHQTALNICIAGSPVAILSAASSWPISSRFRMRR